MIINRQRRIRVRVRDLEDFLARVRRMLALPEHSVSICLVRDAQIAKWNRAYRGKNRATDVLSFPADVARPSVKNLSRSRRRVKTRSGGHVSLYIGDIAIAPAVARRNALQFGRTLPEELRILILHGVLHLMGYDHETDTGQMDRREQTLRRKLGLA
jgi:probable rRNA maturation factor